MALERIYKGQANRTISLGGFDRRGCAATINNATETGFTISGNWADQADFVVFNLISADDNYGQQFTTRYLPDVIGGGVDMTGIVIGFDLAITNGQYPGSHKFQSVPWGSLSWIKSDGSSGVSPLWSAGSEPFGTVAHRNFSITFSGAGSVTGDRVQIIYAGNVIAEHTSASPETQDQFSRALVAAINHLNTTLTTAVYPLSATYDVGTHIITIQANVPGVDGNTIALYARSFTSTTIVTPSGSSKMAGGTDPATFQVELDFSALGLTSLSRAWLTLAPPLPIDTGATTHTLKAFVGAEFSYVFSNYAVTSQTRSGRPPENAYLSLAGPGSIVIGVQDGGSKWYGSWSLNPGAYYHGFGRASAASGDRGAISYSCQYTHNVYLEGLCQPGQGKVVVTVDGRTSTVINCAVGSGSARRLVAVGVTKGKHTVSISVEAGPPCTVGAVIAAVLSDVPARQSSYPNVSNALDFDTAFTYQIPPARVVWNLVQRGFLGDLDFYAGVFFALRRVRYGGNFPVATVTITGTPDAGTGIGDGSAVFVTFGEGTGKTTIGVAAYPTDTLTTMAQRMVNGINATFVGVWADIGGTAGQIIVTSLTPINGFFMTATVQNTGLMVSVSGIPASGTGYAMGPSNEGTWAVDATQTSPLNKAFADWFADLCSTIHAAGITMTCAFSQELLGPPDVDTAGGAWVQRYADRSPVITATGFGSWGQGLVTSYNPGSGHYVQAGHGYLTGYFVNFTSHLDPLIGGQWVVNVIDADTYTLGAQTAGPNTYIPDSQDYVSAALITSQCCFSSSTFTPYVSKCFVQAANIMAAGGLVPWLQMGEMFHWFFSKTHTLAISALASGGGGTKITTATPHGIANGTPVIVAGTGFADGTQTASVIDSLNLTVPAAWPGGTPTVQGTISGGGMAYYDANQQAAGFSTPFYTQDDDPTGHAAPIAVLAGRIQTHNASIKTAVIAAQGGAKFELLSSYDVNGPTCFYSVQFPYPQGGRLNTLVNFPGGYYAKVSSGFDRMKVEALSWQSFYFNFDNFKAMVLWPTVTLAWAKTDIALLIGWNYGGAPWVMAWLYALDQGYALTAGPISFWAGDHDQEFAWPDPLPSHNPTTAN